MMHQQKDRSGAVDRAPGASLTPARFKFASCGGETYDASSKITGEESGMVRRWFFGAALVLSLASVLHAKQGIVRTTDGRTLEGDVTETTPDQAITIVMHGVSIVVPRNTIS